MTNVRIDPKGPAGRLQAPRVTSRRRFRLALGAVVVVATAGSALLGGAFRGSPEAASGGAVETATASGLLAFRGAPAGLAELQARARVAPSDPAVLAQLATAYQQRWRETADAAYLGKAGGVLRRAARVAPNDAGVVASQASLALARHDFRGALALGRRALALAPGSASAYGIVGDALVELGRYGEAFDAFDRMTATKPNVASYARVAYGRELIGQRGRAIAAMQLAVGAARGQGEPEAWSRVELGKLYFSTSRLRAARAEFLAALRAFPGYVYALDALAKLEAARGNHAQAIALARRAADAAPFPQFVTTLGDLYRLTGKERLARQQYALVGVIDRLVRANGVATDIEFALFMVDRGIRPAEALAAAGRAHAARPSIEADDVLAWALARNGRCDEARRYSVRSLRLGTLDAAKFFHRGMIERCLGHGAVARRWFRRAVATNPQFSVLHAPVARRYAS